ncbi:MAG: energy transducer TonB [Paludibacter sp.]|nr:energy transducer TonB [Paludibacter sp.]
MKSILFSLVFLFIPKFCVSQLSANDDAVYLDSLNNMGTAENYKYIRIIKDYKIPNKEPYQVKVFYKSGKIAMAGATSTRIGITKTGTFLYFHENGKRKSILNYEKDKQVGAYFEFHENGNKKLEGEWIDDNKTVIPNIKVKNCWNEDGIQTVKEGSGFFEEIYFQGSLPYRNNVNGFGKGKIVNNLKDSIWSGLNKKTKISYIENYKNGELISGVSIDSNKVEHKYSVTEIRPIPKKGMDNFNRHIAKTFRCPNVEGLRGKIYVTFVVETDGSITDVKVLRDIGYGTGAEAIRAVTSYEGWIPGEQRGIKVRCKFSLPISVQTTR